MVSVVAVCGPNCVIVLASSSFATVPMASLVHCVDLSESEDEQHYLCRAPIKEEWDDTDMVTRPFAHSCLATEQKKYMILFFHTRPKNML